MAILWFPVLLVLFWYKEFPSELLKLFGKVNRYTLELLSLPLLIRTFFTPLKNEYRKDLVVFSVGMGIVVKTGLILSSLIIILSMMCVELLVLVGFLIFPLIPVYLFLT